MESIFLFVLSWQVKLFLREGKHEKSQGHKKVGPIVGDT
jgi:hypothetical protein